MLGRVIYLCFTVFVAITLSYFIASLLIREPMIELNCNEQPIRHGKLLAGVSGLKAIVKCNNGWMNGAPVEEKCLPVSEKRVVVREAAISAVPIYAILAIEDSCVHCLEFYFDSGLG